MMPDQVHLFSKSDPAEAPQHLANQLKGYISQMLRQKFPERRFRMPSVEQKRRRWFDRPGLRENRQAIHRNAAVESGYATYRQVPHPPKYRAGSKAGLFALAVPPGLQCRPPTAPDHLSGNGSGDWLRWAVGIFSRRAPGERRENADTLGQVHASRRQHLLRRLDKSFAAFFRRLRAGEQPGLPRFKRRARFHSIEYTDGDGCKLRQNEPGHQSFNVQNVGEMRLGDHRAIPTAAEIKPAVVKRIGEGWLVAPCTPGDHINPHSGLRGKYLIPQPKSCGR